MSSNKRKGNLIKYFLLFIAAFLWGSTFVAQDIVTDYLGTFTFLAARSFVGTLFLIPVTLIFTRIATKNSIDPIGADGNIIPKRIFLKNSWVGGICCGMVLFVASSLQQAAMVYVTSGKAGFITSMYVIMVPLTGLFLHQKVAPTVWVAVVLTVTGLYLLCMKTNDVSFGIGELLLIGCAVCYTLHIQIINHFVVKANAVMMSCIQFLICGIISTVAMLIFESPSVESLIAAIGPILYAGILSSGIAYTLQLVGQNGTNPTIASIVMSLESVISVLSGWLYLNDQLTLKEIIGCILMFAALIISQLPSGKPKNKLTE